ncbi:hypothetical protein [Acidiphilium acidophilum]|uniref:hypothetical protein n=1 Tax=Acidiphilium acidophilum TaxID=76588 RepID=UPI002E8E7247|nr:hypothetical protein [Acidiphilium acidophilum]
MAAPLHERLHEIIAARQKGRKRAPKPKAAPEPAGNVVKIMDALRQSMKAETSERSRKR